MKFYAYHGVMEQERRVGNTFVVDLGFTAPLSRAVESDQLGDTIHYGEVYETVAHEMQTPSQLIEHAAGRILKALRRRFPQMQTIELTLAKQNPPFGADIASASITLIDKPEIDDK